MNQYERDEIGQLRSYLNKMVFGATGAALTVGLALGGFSIKQQMQITTAKALAESAVKTSDENREDIKTLTSKFSDMNGVLEGVRSELGAQRRAVEAMNESVAELTRYLRGGNIK
jgi:uncharacterized protein HemX